MEVMVRGGGRCDGMEYEWDPMNAVDVRMQCVIRLDAMSRDIGRRVEVDAMGRQ